MCLYVNIVTVKDVMIGGRGEEADSANKDCETMVTTLLTVGSQ